MSFVRVSMSLIKPLLRPSRPRSRLLVLSGVLLVVLLGSVGPRLAPTVLADSPAQEKAEGGTRLFLPTVKQPGETTPPPPPPADGGLFLNRTVKSASAATQVDANGGYHAAYRHYIPEAESPPAVYSYCSGTACNNLANWREVELLPKAREVQLALTPTGKPRLLIVTPSTVYEGGKDFHYAACDANCTQRASWTVTRVVSSWGTDMSDINNDRTPQRSFALDPQGRPRFFYQDRNYFYREPDHLGAFYVFCDSGCHDAANWHETEVGRNIGFDAEIFDLPALTFTSTGQPRVISRVFAISHHGEEAPAGLYYYECNSGCDQTENWQRAFLMPTGGGSYPHPGWDIELDSNNRPRVVIFTGGGLEPEKFNYQLLYLWCETGCMEATSWYFDFVGLESQEGESPDLELNAQGQPRIAWMAYNGDLGYSWCNSACQSENGAWNNQIVETEDELRQAFPQAIPAHCDADIWEGLAPVLSLDRNGNPRIAYDVPVEARCLYDPGDGSEPYQRFMPVWRAARLTYFPQP